MNFAPLAISTFAIVLIAVAAVIPLVKRRIRRNN